MSNPNRPKSRKLRLIYPTFQLRMLFANLASCAIIFALTAWLVNDAFDSMLATGNAAGMASTHPYFALVRQQSHRVIQAVAISCFVGFVISAVTTLRMSHRIAGPFVRLKGYFVGIAQGDPVRPVKFRQGDYFSDIPPAINAALARLDKSNSLSPPK